MRIFVVGAAYGHWGNFHPSDLWAETGPQIGGGETAMVKTAEALAARGHEVVVFANMQPSHWAGVDYVPLGLYEPVACTMEHHVTVSWDRPDMLRYNLRSRARVCAYQLNHAYVGVLDYLIDRYFCPSEWHARRYQTEVTPEATASKFRPRMTNAVDMRRYQSTGEKRNPWGVVWSSSPDRGLHHLLAAWPSIKKAEPKACLHVFYDMQKWFDVVDYNKSLGRILNTTALADLLRQRIKDTEGMDVHLYGGVSQVRLARAQMQSSVGVASLDVVAPTEGFGMTMLEYLAAGLSPIAGAIDAFPELWAQCATLLAPPQSPEALTVAVLAAFKDAKRAQSAGPRLARLFSWDRMGQAWEEELSALVGENSGPVVHLTHALHKWLVNAAGKHGRTVERELEAALAEAKDLRVRVNNPKQREAA